jgi:hypothetical protein
MYSCLIRLTASIAAFAALNVISWTRHLRGANAWKGRPVVAA